MRHLLMTMAMIAGLTGHAQTADLFTTPRESDLRLPSVPLIVSDPYFSIWSPYNTLNEGITEHWTGAKKPLIGALRVDGKVYRFLGEDKINLEAIAPMTDIERWDASYTNSQPQEGWQEIQFDDSSWKNGKAAFGSRDMPRISTDWRNVNSDIYIRRTIDISNPETIAEDLYLIYSHDDVFELYLNGEQLVSTGETWRNDIVMKLSGDIKKKLRKGKNVIAAHCHNTTGGAYVDFGLYKEKADAVKFDTKATQTKIDVLVFLCFTGVQNGIPSRFQRFVPVFDFLVKTA